MVSIIMGMGAVSLWPLYMIHITGSCGFRITNGARDGLRGEDPQLYGWPHRSWCQHNVAYSLAIMYIQSVDFREKQDFGRRDINNYYVKSSNNVTIITIHGDK